MLGMRDLSPPDPAAQPPRPCFIVGLDLGKLSDFSALALLEWTVPPAREKNWHADYAISTLKRWPLGTPYLDIISQVVRFLDGETFKQAQAHPLLVLDATGVGEAVVEAAVKQMIEARVKGGWCAVTITGGNTITPRGGCRWSVSKKQLVSHLQVVMGSRRLHVAPQLPEARTLIRELETFQVKITDAGNESFESWRERDHDDLVLAVALAVWAAEHGLLYGLLYKPAPQKRFRS
jgi:hypothetical protein